MIAEFFVGGIGLLYAAGFLTTFTFLERFDLREMGTDVFRLKYIYVGILFFLFPITIAIPFVALVVLKKCAMRAKKERSSNGKSPAPRLRIPFPSVLAILNMLLMFYIVALFAPPGWVRERREAPMFALILVTLIGAPALRQLEDYWPSKFSYRRYPRGLRRLCGKAQWSERALFKLNQLVARLVGWLRKYSRILRWSLLMALLLLDRLLLHGLWADLYRMFLPPTNGLYYYVLILFCLFVVQRVYTRLSQHRASAIRVPFLLLAAGIIASLFFFSILSFATRVYPYVSVSKGGGDYRHSTPVVVHFTNTSKELIPSEIVDPSEPGIVSIPLTLIEQTSSTLYVAIFERQRDWRTFEKLPDIYAIQMVNVTAILHVRDYTNRNWVRRTENGGLDRLAQSF